ncbi:acyltransferase family protein [Cronobacter sakazakii]|uniref:acyltransferase family protein n=1 Tax=Cronobacter sakazakii TaxID=28141 RepID=UPI0013758964|nr:acyltransferase [Cronobacter sakazakii]NCI09026.1 acyltransferase [Cronobacter sakazakii]
MSRNNCFDIARHIAATLVIFSHHFAFNGMAEPRVLGITKLGTFSVLVFFSISGYLIAASYLKSDSVLSYYKKRIKRVFPALIACSFIMIYFLCPIFGSGPAIDYIISNGAKLAFLDYITLGWHPDNINGFAKNYIHRGMLNGSLWTLGFEFFAYILVSAVFFRKRMVTASCLIVILIAVFTQLAVRNGVRFSYDVDFNRLSLLTVTFFCGSLLFFTRMYWNNIWSKLTLISIALLCAIFISDKNEYDLMFYISVPFFVVPLCTMFSDKIINGRFDISYGMYIYAYPIQQVVINNTKTNFIASLFISVSIIIILASLSWLLIERRFINHGMTAVRLQEAD